MSEAALWKIEAVVDKSYGQQIFFAITTCAELAIGMVHAKVMEDGHTATILSVQKQNKFAKLLFDANILQNETSNVTVMAKVVGEERTEDDPWTEDWAK